MGTPWRSSPCSAPLTYSVPFAHPLSLLRSQSLAHARSGVSSCLAERPAASELSRPHSRPAQHPLRPAHAPPADRKGPGRHCTLQGGRREQTPLTRCSLPSRLCSCGSLNSGLAGLVGHWVVKTPITCVSGRLTQHIHTTLGHTCLGSGHRIRIPDVQCQCLQGARRASSSPGCLQQWSLCLQVPHCGIH